MGRIKQDGFAESNVHINVILSVANVCKANVCSARDDMRIISVPFSKINPKNRPCNPPQSA
jgi:hypothetical protein